MVCWFSGKNISNFVDPGWKLHNYSTAIARGIYCSVQMTHKPVQTSSAKQATGTKSLLSWNMYCASQTTNGPSLTISNIEDKFVFCREFPDWIFWNIWKNSFFNTNIDSSKFCEISCKCKSSLNIVWDNNIIQWFRLLTSFWSNICRNN